MNLKSTVQCDECSWWVPKHFRHEMDDNYHICTGCAADAFPDQISEEQLIEFQTNWLMD